MDGVLLILDRAGKAIAELEAENTALRQQVETLGRLIADRESPDET